MGRCQTNLSAEEQLQAAHIRNARGRLLDQAAQALGKGNARRSLEIALHARADYPGEPALDLFIADIRWLCGEKDAALSEIQTVKALMEADAWDGPSLVIAYSTCIAHGIDMETSMSHQKQAVKSGYWPLYRYRPTADEHEHPFQLDSAAPSIPLRDFALTEARYAMLARTDPERSNELLDLAQVGIDERWHYYEQLSSLERSVPTIPNPDEVVSVEITTGDRSTEHSRTDGPTERSTDA